MRTAQSLPLRRKGYSLTTTGGSPMVMHAYRALFVALALLGLSSLAGGRAARAGDKETVVKAADLARSYALDPKDFDRKYKDKTLIVEGVVETPAAKGALDKKTWVMLKGFAKKGDPVETLVRCEMTKELEGLRAGQQVRIRGTCHGHNQTVFAAELVNCKLEKGAGK